MAGSGLERALCVQKHGVAGGAEGQTARWMVFDRDQDTNETSLDSGCGTCESSLSQLVGNVDPELVNQAA